jgi:hypothetical protein
VNHLGEDGGRERIFKTDTEHCVKCSVCMVSGTSSTEWIGIVLSASIIIPFPGELELHFVSKLSQFLNVGI